MTPLCLVEVRELNLLAKTAELRGEFTKATELRKQANNLSNTDLNPDGLSSNELRKKYTAGLMEETGANRKITQESPEFRAAFLHYARTGEIKPELRDVAVGGTDTITYTPALPTGSGSLVDIVTEATMFESIAQTDPLLSDKVVDFVMSPTPYVLKPIVLTGVDLSTNKAQQINELSQQLPQNTPTIAGFMLRGNIGYRYSQAISIEADTDIPNLMAKYARWAGVGFARQLGIDAALGNGGLNTPRGLFPYLGPAIAQIGLGVEQVGSQATGNITALELNTVYFSVNRIYRSMPKCAWLCSDAVYKKIRNATDNQGRPLLDMQDDREMLLGKPLYVSPSFSTALTSEGAGALVFGDMDHFHVRVSKPWFTREINQAGVADITKGQCLYVSRVKMDSAFFDPSQLSNPPIVWASVHA